MEATPVKHATSVPRRWRRRWAIGAACIALTAVAIARSGRVNPSTFSMFIRDPWDAIPRATPEEIAKVHEPEALRADLDVIVALHERTCPNLYLRFSRESIPDLAERLKDSIDRPMTRR